MWIEVWFCIDVDDQVEIYALLENDTSDKHLCCNLISCSISATCYVVL